VWFAAAQLLAGCGAAGVWGVTLERTGVYLTGDQEAASSRWFCGLHGVTSIHRRFGCRTANLLETECSGSHTPATEIEACRSMRQRFRPLSAAEPRWFDHVIAGGTERAWASIMNVSHAAYTVARYATAQAETRHNVCRVGKQYWLHAQERDIQRSMRQ